MGIPLIYNKIKDSKKDRIEGLDTVQYVLCGTQQGTIGAGAITEAVRVRQSQRRFDRHNNSIVKGLFPEEEEGSSTNKLATEARFFPQRGQRRTGQDGGNTSSAALNTLGRNIVYSKDHCREDIFHGEDKRFKRTLFGGKGTKDRGYAGSKVLTWTKECGEPISKNGTLYTLGICIKIGRP